VLEALFAEIQAEECELRNVPLERWLRIVRLALFSKLSGLVLVEDSVIYADGRIQERGRLLSEKIVGDEAPKNCTTRAVAEELPIGDLSTLEIFSVSKPSIEYRESTPSYPGLKSRYEIYDVSATIGGLPSGDFFTDEYHGGNLIATHKWHWSNEIPNKQNK
jgi:hypothetical protein